MRTLVLAIAIVLLLACSRKPAAPAAPTAPGVSKNAAPTCDKKRFDAAVERFDVLEVQRNEIIKLIEALELNEYYDRHLDAELPKAASLVVKVQAVSVPQCLESARDTLVLSFQQTYDALEQRRPSRGLGGYAAGRMQAKRSYDEFVAEVQAQAGNAN